MSRIVRKPITLIGLFALSVALWIFWKAVPASTVHASPLSSAAIDLQSDLIRAGLEPRSLAAAGITSNQVAGIVTAVSTALTNDPTGLSGADSSYASARDAADALSRKIQSGLATAQEIASFASVEQTLTSATNTRQASIDALFSAGTKGLAPQVVLSLSKCRVNHAAWDLPTEFLLVDHTEVDWVTLRDALANERITAKYGDTPDATLQAKLAVWRADPTVAAAKIGLDTNLAPIEAAWNSAAQ